MVVSTDAWTPVALLLMQTHCEFPGPRYLGYVYLISATCSVTYDGNCRYCICTMSSVDSGEAKFMIFERFARGLIGKPLINLLQLRYPLAP